MSKFINLYATEAEYAADTQRPSISVSLVTATNKIYFSGSEHTVGETARQALNEINSRIDTINKNIAPLIGKTVVTQ